VVDPWAASLISVAIVSLISFSGALTLVFRAARSHIVLLALVAYAAGTLLGDSFLHLLPEAVEGRGGVFSMGLSAYVLGGFLAFYLLETALRWGHAHGEEAHPHVAATVPDLHQLEREAPRRVAPFAWMNLVGDGVHNFVDGALIAASFLVNFELGIATSIAVAAHEIPQELGDFAVLLKGGLKATRALFYNFLSALLAILGAIVILVIPIDAPTLELAVVPFIAGAFVYIAAADLIPELHHHTERRYIPVVALGIVLGLVTMGSLLFLE